jgi:hypothetical protein
MTDENEEIYNSYLKSHEDRSNYDSAMGVQQPAPVQVAEVPVAAPVPALPVRDKFAEMESEMAKQRRENEELRYNLELWKSQMAKQNQPVPAIQQIDNDEALTRGVYEEDVSSKMSALEKKIADLEFEMTRTAVQSKYHDYDEVINNYTVPLANKNPYLAQTIRDASNKPQVAYELGKQERELQQLRAQVAQQPTQQYSYQQAQAPSPQMRMLENAMKPGSLSMTGGQGSFTPQKVDYANMSDAEFDAAWRKNTRDH